MAYTHVCTHVHAQSLYRIGSGPLEHFGRDKNTLYPIPGFVLLQLVQGIGTGFASIFYGL